MLAPLDIRPHAYYRSPIGTIEVIGDERGLTSVRFIEIEPPTDDVPPVLEEAIGQLDEYFRGERTTFSLPLAPEGTPFDQNVWEKLEEIEYGRTRSYMEIAVDLGNPRAVRAVGHANGRNRIWIIIPCHRVIGSNGSLTGYAGESRSLSRAARPSSCASTVRRPWSRAVARTATAARPIYRSDRKHALKLAPTRQQNLPHHPHRPLTAEPRSTPHRLPVSLIIEPMQTW
jgi:methylated-DNA-[protein]-cysteine S-methyltransferase